MYNVSVCVCVFIGCSNINYNNYNKYLSNWNHVHVLVQELYIVF